MSFHMGDKGEDSLMEAMEEIPYLPNMPTIPEFYKGKSIFITGGTGFMGKVLIEKLLWSCPDLETIYLLLRPKKGKNSIDRLEEIEKSKLFGRLRERDPKCFFSKIKVINGDVALLGLGLTIEDRKTLIDSVSIIFHAAASVRFDDSLKEAVLLNTRGCREVMMLAREVKNLSVILHVSTTYCNTDKNPVYEKLYPPHADWKKTIEIAEAMDDQLLRVLTTKYIKDLPNTYVFTKSMAEHVVNDLRGDIPAVIYRPSIVVNALEEPLIGWMENFNGPVGLLVACGKGIMRSMCAVSHIRADYIPVDVAIKGLIVAAWRHGAKRKYEPEIPVYNCSSAMVKEVTYGDTISIGLEIVKDAPLNNILWAPGGGFTQSKVYHFINVVLFHLLPAFFIDILLKLTGNKAILFKVHRRIYIASEALRFFIINEWLFKNTRFLQLRNTILPKDKEAFNYNFEDSDVKEYFTNCLLGARRYLLNEADETMPAAKAHFKRMTILDRVCKTIFWTFVVWYLYNSTFIRSVLNEMFIILTGSN